ncbi:hypothetical protein N7539_002895 [Penicillium diatomitis]|uniref:SAC domain-containing protein n=1 Tax=Penicillium diatomitis TaxID=2819901 RepID=A0A9W9XG62_9EURO|nr:uncharacterized protein N7539_002895 [Penicillium diatomitis]KAJ5491328.1 hypothetical protein N7539_002895 [Penicillium diatomitis]
MPGLLRKLVIVAAVDGLVLHGTGVNGLRQKHNGNSNEASCIKIDYKTKRVTTVPAPLDSSEEQNALEAYGLVGLLSIASYSFLVSISQRQQVAQIQGRPIYAVTNVAIIPVSTQEDAGRAIDQARKEALQTGADLDTESEEEEEEDVDRTTDRVEMEISSVPSSPVRETPPHQRDMSVSSIAEEVIGKRVRFGSFAANWLSRKTPGLARPSASDRESLESPFEKSPRESVDGSGRKDEATKTAEAAIPKEVEEHSEAQPDPALPGEADRPVAEQASQLLPKLLRWTKVLFASRNFFFSYDYDLTRSFEAQELWNAHQPLHKRADPLYFWNRYLMNDLVDNGVHAFVLPLVQGFVGQRQFTVAASADTAPSTESPEETPVKAKVVAESTEAPEATQHEYLLTLISRRSVKRPGLRYLRRGVDDEGNTANTVETEQILSVPDWNTSRKVYSFLQVRGSIPLYFSQSPYSFKPVPIMHHSADVNHLAFGRHFREMSRRYGKVQAVSLIDKHAGELKLGEQYQQYTKAFNESGGIDGEQLQLEWFDFHNECRGMKFENVSRLVDRLKSTLEQFGYAAIKDGSPIRTQTGIIRTNCMDCLDRTGVAQCAFGQWALEQQLQAEGLKIDLGGDSSTQWFNILWGDYTRTRKRDYRGALNDFGLTLSRYYNNIVNDYFSQACIDYLLGNVSTHVFEEFAVELQTTDPGISVEKIRQNAIDTSCKIVISSPSEEFLGGWTMLTPRQPSTLRTLPFEETVLLLTDAAVYSCRFDWETDKVLSFERIDLRSISRIHYGTYITSILTDSQADERSNVGLVIVYRDGEANALRVNTRSLQSNVQPAALEASANNEWDLISWLRGTKRSTSRFIAFKSLPAKAASVNSRLDSPSGIQSLRELDRVRSICLEIERAMLTGDGQNKEAASESVVEESDIISLEEAKKRTGLLEHLVHDIKKMVWA